MHYRMASVREVSTNQSANGDWGYSSNISSNSYDGHGTSMDARTTLPNFAREAAQGVTLKDSHLATNGFGVSTAGRVEKDGDTTLVVADFAVSRDVPLNPPATYPNSDVFIRMIEEGKIREMSVGFSGGAFECDLCGQDMFRSAGCKHWIGFDYEIEKENRRCTATITDAHLAEVSLVYKGSNPDASIVQRFERMCREGLLSEKQISVLTDRYQIPSSRSYSFPSDVPRAADGEGEESMSAELEKAYNVRLEGKDEEIARLREQLEESQAQVTDLTAKNAELTELAEHGKRAFTDAVEEAVVPYKSFLSSRHSEDPERVTKSVADFKKRMTAMSFDEVRQTRAHYEELCETIEKPDVPAGSNLRTEGEKKTTTW